MAVDEQQAHHDMYDMTFRDWDERVQVGEWVYYVRGVKRRWELEHEEWEVYDASVVLDILVLQFVKVYRWWVRRGAWCAAVVRIGSVSSWNSVTPKVVHFERLEEGVEPPRRIADLVEEVKRGQFAPSR